MAGMATKIVHGRRPMGVAIAECEDCFCHEGEVSSNIGAVKWSCLLAFAPLAHI